ncbi:hypothetical protein [Nonomuraea sp. NPDC049725]|uniref:hypothetical protein n=1 Tax=Nonomuraea sp. NPDC049725 TaxID=3154508 RepID=UPI003449C496
MRHPTEHLPRRAVRAVLRSPLAAALAVAVVLAGAGTAAANDWVPIFRTERIEPVGVGAADLVALPDLSAYGDVVVTGGDGPREVPDAAAAKARTGLDVPVVRTLPRGVAGEPVHQVVDEMTATFTFSADRAGKAAAEAGQPLPPPPPGLDGQRVRLVAGPGVAGIWSQPAGVPALVVGRAVAPRALSSGVPYASVRDYLLTLPGLPDEAAALLRAFGSERGSLPLPVPAGRFTTSRANVHGVPATVIATRDRTLAAVVWVDGGVVTAVAGALDAAEVLAVARDLR